VGGDQQQVESGTFAMKFRLQNSKKKVTGGNKNENRANDIDIYRRTCPNYPGLDEDHRGERDQAQKKTLSRTAGRGEKSTSSSSIEERREKRRSAKPRESSTRPLALQHYLAGTREETLSGREKEVISEGGTRNNNLF